MKKVVFVSTLQIFPPMSGGQLRSANLCRVLVKLGYEVEVYSLTGRKDAYKNRKSSFSFQPEHQIRETVNMNPLWGFIQFLFYYLELPSMWATWLLNFYVPRTLKRLMLNADQVILDFPFLYPLFAACTGVKVLNTHNAEFELWKARPWISTMVRNVELKGFEKADHVIFCCEEDRQKFNGTVSGLIGKSSIVSNGVDTSLFEFKPSVRSDLRNDLKISDQQKVFLFTGSSYLPNQEAFQFLKQFCSEHQEQLIKAQAVVVVAGTVSEEKVNAPHFKVLGKVADMMPFFAASDFGLNPMALGSGVNVKMVEYMVAKLPILSTDFGCRGLDLEHRNSCIVFERANLLQSILDVLDLPEEERRQMPERALVANQERVDMSKALGKILS